MYMHICSLKKERSYRIQEIRFLAKIIFFINLFTYSFQEINIFLM